MTIEPSISLSTMAEAMLADDYKTSHPDLKKWADLSNRGEENGKHRKEEKAELPKEKSVKSPRKSDIRRSVSIQLPPKRPRMCTTITAKEVVEAINSCFLQSDRFAALQMARTVFDHGVQSVHDEEITAGADMALTKHLALLHLLFHSPTGILNEQESLVSEMNQTCEALEMVYRASPNSVCLSFRRVGNTLMQLFVALIEGEVSRRGTGLGDDNFGGEFYGDEANLQGQTNHDEKKHAGEENRPQLRRLSTNSRCNSPFFDRPESDILLRKITKILGHFARVGEATRPMAYFPGLLGSILRIISFRPYESLPWEARLSCLWTLANLACNSDNMQMMMCVPGLVNSLVSVACRPFHQGGSLEATMEVLRSRSLASRGLLNLSWAPENKIPLAENMSLVELLAQLAVFRDAPLAKSRTVREVLLQTRMHAVGAIRNLAAAPRRTKILLCQYKKGKLLDVLTDAALNDVDAGVKNRALAAIHNLAVHDTAEMMVDRPALVLALKDVLLSEESSDQGQGEDSPKSHASGTLLVLERTITPDMTSYENLRDLLEAVNPMDDTDAECGDGLGAIQSTPV